MFVKCLLLLFVLSDIEADYYPRRSWSRNRMDWLGGCTSPTIDHGRIKKLQRGKMVKFICSYGYQLVGNRYATCWNSNWDVPIPVCAKAGCPIPKINNSVTFTRHDGAWIEVFCSPEHELVGSSAIYCDGRKWNATAPSCVETKKPAILSCDFEDSNICGWKQDENHDFDWRRINGKTPSSFLLTGPKVDHTLGSNGTADGYYMYIESTSRAVNDTARLISPIYEAKLTKNGCFSFYYHMFGMTTGGLRIYQKPDKGTQKYIIFEKWGNQGDFWYRGVPQLNSSVDDFQIIIEGIRGASFTSDIAIDDVAILQGANCTSAIASVSTPATTIPDSCVGRCDIAGLAGTPVRELNCGCTASCLSDEDCCPDFFDTCVFDATDYNPDSGELPQTQKLVASTTSAATTTKIPTTTPETTTMMSTTKSPTKATTKKITTITIPTEAVNIKTSTQAPTVALKTTTKVENGTGILRKDNITTHVFKPTTKRWTTKMATTKAESSVRSTHDPKAVTEQLVQNKPVTAKSGRSSGLKTGLITTAALLCILAAAAWLIMTTKTVRGRIALARLRGHTTRDTEVRYLNADADDDN